MNVATVVVGLVPLLMAAVESGDGALNVLCCNRELFPTLNQQQR